MVSKQAHRVLRRYQPANAAARPDWGDKVTDQLQSRVPPDLAPKVNPELAADRDADVEPVAVAVNSVATTEIATPLPADSTTAAMVYPRWPLYVIAWATVLVMLKLGQSFVVPVVIAVLIFYALVFPVDALERVRVPRAVGAAFVVLALVAATTLTMYAVWAQLDRIAEAVPRAVLELKTRYGQMKVDQGSTLAKLQGGAEAVQRAMTDEVVPANRARATQSGQATPSKPATPPVAAVAPGSGVMERMFWSGTVTALEFISTLAAIYLLAYFLLVDGDHFRRRCVSFVGKALSTKRVTVHALDAIDLSIRRYLAMLVVTNTVLGVLTYVALRIVGVEDAAGWGVLAFLLHVIPYFGPILVAGGVFVTSLHQLGDLHSAVYAALSTVLVSIIIGTFAQTWMTARIVKMNTSVVFVAILLFGALWGGAGLLLAVPIAVIIKVVLGAVPVLNPIGKLLGDGRSDA